MKILIIDSNNTMHRAYHSYRGMQNSGNPVSIVYGMPILVNALINQLSPDKVIMCWDGAKHKERIRLNPEYKAGRRSFTEQEKKAFDKQKNKVREIFHALGIPQIIHPEMEADDYIYMLVKKYKKDKKNKITIVSTDKDFHQLICSNVKIWNTASRRLIHKKNLRTLYNYEPKECVDYLCMIGDDSDNIKGYRGIGAIKAREVLNVHSSINNLIETKKEFLKIDLKKLEDVYSINRQLIDLRFFYRKYIRSKIKFTYYNKDREPKLNTKALFKICNEFNIKSFKDPKFLANYK